MAGTTVPDWVVTSLIDAGIIAPQSDPAGTAEPWSSLVRSGDNRVWRAFDKGGRAIVVRLSTKNRTRDANREETHNQTIAASLGLAPEILYADDRNGLIVSRYIDGATLTPADFEDADCLTGVTLALKALHGANTPFQYQHKFLDGVSRREKAVGLTGMTGLSFPHPSPQGGEADIDMAYLRTEMTDIRALLQASAPAQVPCHSDLVTHNITRAADGGYLFIDWEVSGMGDPHEELANLLWSMSAEESQIQTAIDTYFSDDDSLGRARTRLYLALIPYDWVLRLEQKAASAAPETNAAVRKRQEKRFKEAVQMLASPHYAAAKNILGEKPVAPDAFLATDTRMKPDQQLTAVITFRNEGIEVLRTVEEIRRTSGHAVAIHLIDDASDDGYDYEAVAERHACRLDRFDSPRGPAENRDYGVEQAKTPYAILLDAHMRFYQNDWHTLIIEKIQEDPEALYCTISRPLDKDGNKSGPEGIGASVRFEDDERANLYLPKWNVAQIGSSSTPMVPCVLGATYCFDINFFKKIRGYNGLKQYGGEESFISMKAWMVGGRCKVIQDVTIGHIYRQISERPWRTHIYFFWYSKLVLAAILLNEKDFQSLKEILVGVAGYDDAFALYEDNRDYINGLKKDLQRSFVHDLDYFKALNDAFLKTKNLEAYFSETGDKASAQNPGEAPA